MVCLAFGWQLPFSPAALPGVGSYPGQQACSLDGFLPLVEWALFLPGAFFVAVPVLCLLLCAAVVFGCLAALFAEDFLVGAIERYESPALPRVDFSSSSIWQNRKQGFRFTIVATNALLVKAGATSRTDAVNRCVFHRAAWFSSLGLSRVFRPQGLRVEGPAARGYNNEMTGTAAFDMSADQVTITTSDAVE